MNGEMNTTRKTAASLPGPSGTARAASASAVAPRARGWLVREAAAEDAEAVAGAVRALLVELDGAPHGAEAMERAARAVIESPSAGVVPAMAGA